MMHELSVLKDILRNLGKPLRRRFFHIWILMSCNALLDVVAIVTLGLFVGSVETPEVITHNAYFIGLQKILGFNITIEGRQQALVVSGLAMIITCMAKMAMRASNEYRMYRFSSTVDSHFGNLILKNILYQDYQSILNTQSMANVHSYVGWRTFFGTDYVRYILIMMEQGTILVFVVGLLLLKFPLMTIFIVSLFSVLTQFIFSRSRRLIDRSTKNYLDGNLQAAEHVGIAFSGLKEVKVNGLEQQIATLFREILGRHIDYRTMQIFSMRIPNFLLEFAGYLAFFVITFFICYSSSRDGQSITLAATFSVAMLRIMGVFNSLMSQLPTLRVALPYIEELNRRILNPAASQLAERSFQASRSPNKFFTRVIELDDVGYRYPSAETPTLSGITLSLRQGETVGVIGQSGSGKSTLVDVFSGLILPTTGTLRLDGEPIIEANQYNLLRSISYVSQMPFFFNGTLAQNIAFSLEDAEIDFDRVAWCCAQGCIDFLDPEQGVRMPIREHGTNFSGGQRQRIAIARGLYREKPIIIWDEPTTGMDIRTESTIIKHIEALKKDKTMFLITHRPPLMEICDRLIWVQAGKLKMEGPAADVIALFIESTP